MACGERQFLFMDTHTDSNDVPITDFEPLVISVHTKRYHPPAMEIQDRGSGRRAFLREPA